MTVIRRPQQPAIGLNFSSRKSVVFELGSERQVDPIVDKHDLILGEDVEERLVIVCRIKRHAQTAHGAIVRVANPKAPYDVVPVTQRQVVLKIHVEFFTIFGEDGAIALASVVIRLDCYVRAGRESMTPPRQHISAPHLIVIAIARSERWSQGNQGLTSMLAVAPVD